MAWKKDGDNGDDNGGKRPKNPWDRGPSSGSDGNNGNNPWGGGDKPGQPGKKDRPSSPDFDEFIKRSQARLRDFGSSQRRHTPRHPGGGGGGGGGGNGINLGNLPIGRIAAAVVVVFLLASSAYRIDAGERGVVTRFGKYIGTTGPGFHFKLPTPISHVRKVNFEHIRTIQIGNPDSDHENLMITGDQNIINIVYQVRWRLKNAEDFQFQIAEQEGTVRDATESAMREIIGRSTLINAIGPARATIAEEVKERVQQILDSYGAGVLVQGIDINKADPPAAVDEAFKDVSAAQQDAEQYMNQAQAYAEQILAQAAGDTAAFNKVYEEYRLAPEVTRKRMYLDTMQSVMSTIDKTVIDAKGVQTYLPLSEVERKRQNAEGDK